MAIQGAVLEDIKLVTGVQGTWRFRGTSTGTIELHREHSYTDTQDAIDALGPYWLLAVAEISSGHVHFKTRQGPVAPSAKMYGIYLPPFSLVFTDLIRTHQKMRCYISNGKVPLGSPDHAVVFDWQGRFAEASFEQILAALRNNRQEDIAANSDPSGVARRIKGKIDRSFQNSMKLGEIAKASGLSPTLLGRYFRREFGITPVQYRNHMRIVASTFELLKGKMVSDVFTEVGFEDLSRFTKQFKAVTGSNPGSFRVRGTGPKSRKTPSRS